MRTRDLLKLHNTGHPGINALFAKAHSADWDFEQDVDWSVPVEPDDPLVGHGWAAYGQTPTFQALPEPAKVHATRRAVGRMLNILQVGESVAQNVCARLVLGLREEDYRNHAAAQAMDEARHHLAYRRFIDAMGEEVEDIDAGTEMMFDALLSMDDPLELIATEQFFLESFAMNIFEGLRREATHPLLRRIIELITRDESRHMGFGVLYIAERMRRRAARAADRVRAALAGADPRLPPRSPRAHPARARHPPAARGRRDRRGRARTPAAPRAAGDQRRRARRRRLGSQRAASAEERAPRGPARARHPRGARSVARTR